MDDVTVTEPSGRPLNTTDILGLAERLEIRPLSLEPIGINQTVYIRELTESDRANISALQGDIKVNNKSSTTSFDAGSLDRHSNAKYLSAALWDKAAGKLVADVILEQKSNRSRRKVYEEFLNLPSRFVSFVAGEIRDMNGIDAETVEERGNDD